MEDAAGESTVPDLEQGPRAEHDLNGENLNLARYCAQAELELEEAEALARECEDTVKFTYAPWQPVQHVVLFLQAGQPLRTLTTE